MPGETYSSVLSEAIEHFATHGFVSADDWAVWSARLRRAAEAELIPEAELTRQLREALGATYRRLVDEGQLLKHHPGISRFTYERIRPRLRAELDRRIFASADLIKLNRQRAIEDTVQRLSGWISSVPAGGITVNRRERKAEIRKPLASLPFRERRVTIDQASRMVAAIHDLTARDGGAIACRWRHIKHMPGYQARPDHVARDGRLYLLRDSWARDLGLVRPGAAGFSDEVEQPAQLIYCRCTWIFLYGLTALPEEMLTRKGQIAIQEGRAQLAS